MLKLQVVLVPPSALNQERKRVPVSNGYPNSMINSSPNFFSRDMGTSTPNTNNSSHLGQTSTASVFEKPSFRKFLHITHRGKSLLEVAHEISLRFEKLYPDENPLEILKLQDSQECDLDPDYKASDVFDYDNIVRVILNNEIISDVNVSGSADISEINNAHGKRPASQIFSSLVVPKKRFKDTRDTSIWRGVRESEGRESRKSTPLSNQIYPDEEEKQPEASKSANTSVRNISVNAEDSADLSLPPPDEDDTRYLDPKKSKASATASPLPPSSKRITSGMLVAPEPQLKDAEEAVLEEKQHNEEITQRIIPVKKPLEEKTLDKISMTPSSSRKSSDESVRISKPDDSILSVKQLEKPQDPAPSAQPSKKASNGSTENSAVEPVDKPSVSNHSATEATATKSAVEADFRGPVGDFVTKDAKPSTESVIKTETKAASKPARKPAAKPISKSATKPSAKSTERSSKGTEKSSDDSARPENVSTSDIISNAANITSKDGFSDSDEEENKNEPEFTKDEIMKIFKNGRLPASVKKKFATHASVNAVPTRQVRAAALKAAEKMSIPVNSASATPATSQDTESGSEESSDDGSDEDTEESGESKDATPSEPLIKGEEAKVKPVEKTEEANSKPADQKGDKKDGDDDVVMADKSSDSEEDSSGENESDKESEDEEVEDKMEVDTPKKTEKSNNALAPTKAETNTGAKDAEIARKNETPKKVESTKLTDVSKVASSNAKKEVAKSFPNEAESSAALEIPKKVEVKPKTNSQEKPNEDEIQSTSTQVDPTKALDDDTANEEIKGFVHNTPQGISHKITKAQGKRVNVDDLPQEFPTEEVEGLAEVIARLKDPNISDFDFNEMLKERKRLLYNAKRRAKRREERELKLAAKKAAAVEVAVSQPSQPSQPISKPSLSPVSSSQPQATNSAMDNSVIDPEISQLSQESVGNTGMRASVDRSSFLAAINPPDAEKTRREYERAKAELDRKRKEALENARRYEAETRAAEAKQSQKLKISGQKSEEFVNSSDSGSSSGSDSGSDSDSDSDSDDEDDDDKSKKPPRIVNTPKGFSSQPITKKENLRKSIAANKLVEVPETASAPVTPRAKNALDTPSKDPVVAKKDGAASKKTNSRYSLSSLSDLVSRGVPDVLDSLTPKSLRNAKQSPQNKPEEEAKLSKGESSNNDSSDADSDTEESSSDDSDNDTSSSDEELKGSKKYLSAKTAKNLIGSQKKGARTSSAFKGLMKDAKKK